MPLRNQTDPTRIQPILRLIFSQPRPPVARCRLLSSGFGPSYMLMTSDDLVGSKACLGCGCCIDACPVLAREPKRRLRSEARTSLASRRWSPRIVIAAGIASWPARKLIQPSSTSWCRLTWLRHAELLVKATSDEMFVLDLVLSS